LIEFNGRRNEEHPNQERKRGKKKKKEQNLRQTDLLFSIGFV